MPNSKNVKKKTVQKKSSIPTNGANFKKIVIANWKMNPVSDSESEKIFNEIKKVAETLSIVQTIIAPPFLFICALSKIATGRKVSIAAQDAFDIPTGAYTSQISAAMLAKAAVQTVILGHSERRAVGDTNEIVNNKVKAALKVNLQPVVCIGESKRDSNGLYYRFIEQQLKESLAGLVKTAGSKIIVAYEPIWAIGSAAKREATPTEINEMAIFIRKVLTDIFGQAIGNKIAILYGGSVHPENAVVILSEGGMNGLLVGRDSLDPKKFNKILKAAELVATESLALDTLTNL